MVQIELKIGGTELAKVLHFYGLLEDTEEYKICCPFHKNDINPSMKINLIKGDFFCFGCGETGDALKFVTLVNKELDELHSTILYYEILKSDEVQHIKIDFKKLERRGNKQALNEAHDYYYGLKTTDWKEESWEKEYMEERGFSNKTLRLAKAKLTYNVSYPIVFPMYDLNKFHGWVCRTDIKTIEKKRKYLYNEGFSRSSTLVGNYDSEVVVIVEGYMDRLKMRQFGIKHVCAILGWKTTDEQIAKLKKQGVKHIISALDNDKCGKDGTTYLKQFFNVIRFQFPKGCKDPGEMNSKTFKIAYNKTKKLFRGN